MCRDCPEGTEWILLPSQSEGIINISCGPTGLVWAITWDGHAIVRTHVSRDAVYGRSLFLQTRIFSAIPSFIYVTVIFRLKAFVKAI